MRHIFNLFTTALLISIMPASVNFNGHIGITSAAYAEEAWKEKIMELCAKTDVAMTLSAQELKELIAGCDKLKPVIETLEETPRKVYRKRLQMCRDLFAYVLESKSTATEK